MTESRSPRLVLEARNVSKTYHVTAGIFGKPKTVPAVKSVSLHLAENEALGLIGESGCGKSTLSRMLLGLEAPTSGEVMLDGKPISRLNRRGVARVLQPVFQDPYSSLNPRETVESAVERPLYVHGISDAARRRQRVAEVIDAVGLPRRAHASYAVPEAPRVLFIDGEMPLADLQARVKAIGAGDIDNFDILSSEILHRDLGEYANVSNGSDPAFTFVALLGCRVGCFRGR